jgi:hypothetical protein
MADGLNMISQPMVTGPDIAGQFSKNYLAQTSADLQKAEAADIRDKMITRNRIMAMNEKARQERNNLTPMDANSLTDQWIKTIGQKKPQQPSPQQVAQQQQQVQQKQEQAQSQNSTKLLASILSVADKTKDPAEREKVMAKFDNPQVQDLMRRSGWLPETKTSSTEVDVDPVTKQETNIYTDRIQKDVKEGEIPNLPAGRYELSRRNGVWQAPKKVDIIPLATAKEEKELMQLARPNNPDTVQRDEAQAQIDRLQKMDKSKTPSEVSLFETVTGEKKENRGTPDYEKRFIKFESDKLSGRIPAYQTVADMPNMRFNRKIGSFEMAPSPNSPERQAEIRGATKSLYNSRKMYDMTMQAERQAERNIKIVQDVSNKYIRSRFPLPNKFWAAVRTGTGDPIMGEVQVKLLAASREYMRVVTGGARSAAELSIAAQTKADEIMNNSDSWEVVNAKTSAMIQELKATEKSFKDQMQEQQDVISGKVAPDTQEPKKETRETKTINGKPYYKVGDKWYAD